MVEAYLIKVYSAAKNLGWLRYVVKFNMMSPVKADCEVSEFPVIKKNSSYLSTYWNVIKKKKNCVLKNFQ